MSLRRRRRYHHTDSDTPQVFSVTTVTDVDKKEKDINDLVMEIAKICDGKDLEVVEQALQTLQDLV